MAEFAPFDIGSVFRNAEAIKSMKNQSVLDGLQAQYLQGQIGRAGAQEQRAVAQEGRAAAQENRAATDWSQEQQLANTRFLNMAAAEVAKNPQAAQRWEKTLKSIDPSFTWGDPAQIQQSASRLFESTSAALQAFEAGSGATQAKPSALVEQYAVYQAQGGRLPFVDPNGQGNDFITQFSRSQVGAQFGSPINQPGVGVVQPSRTDPARNVTLAPEASVVDAAANRASTEAQAKTAGAGAAERELNLPAARARLARSTANFDRLASSARDLLANDNLWKAVGLGKGLSVIPGSAGADIRAAIENLQSQAGLSVLQDMRDNSQTGGAVGQVSNFEQQIFQNNISALGNLNQSPESFRRQLEKLIDFAEDSKSRFGAAFQQTYPGLQQSNSTPSNAGNGPVQIQSDADYEALPSGAQYVAPDGSVRTKR